MSTDLREVSKTDSYRESWLEDLMDEYGDRLTRLAFNYLKDWGKAQEVVQEVFLTCYKNYDTYRDITTYKAWIYRITINRCKDILKSSWFKRVVINSTLYENIHSKESSPEQAYIQNEGNTKLIEKIFTLPVKYREVILLFYYEELSVKEISELLKYNQNTVKTRLKRGRELLSDFFKGSDIHEK